jgi:ribosome biogenesis GTPase A
MDSDTLARAVNAWDVVGRHQKTILFMGYTNTGRSTYLELINKYQHGVKSPGLVFEKDKYLHDGVISAKTIKIQTVLPAVYKN